MPVSSYPNNEMVVPKSEKPPAFLPKTPKAAETAPRNVINMH